MALHVSSTRRLASRALFTGFENKGAPNLLDQHAPCLGAPQVLDGFCFY